MAASWWDNPQAKGDNPVVAHTPDETQYHYPDDRQMERMRGGIAMGVIVPRANDDGTSKGFDGGVAGVVHVDPDAPDGGAVVDLSQLDPHRYDNAFRQSTYPHEVFYQLGASPKSLGMTKQAKPQARPTPRSNHLVPQGSYIVPAAGEDGTQQFYQLPPQEEPMKPIPPLPPMSQPVPVVQQPVQAPVTSAPGPVASAAPYPQAQQVPVYAQPQAPQQPFYAYPPPPPAAPPVPPLDLDRVYTLIGHLSSQVNQLANHVQQQATVPPVTTPQLRTVPAEAHAQPPRRRPPQPSAPAQPIPRHEEPEEDQDDYAPQQTLQQVREAARDEIADGVVMGFETLNMKFLKGPIAEKPKREVFFTMPGMGAMSTRYHAVQTNEDCVALVYDTRYEDGTQFLPPNLGEKKIEVAVTKVSRQGKRAVERHICSSMGIHFNIGVLDIIVLIKHHEEEDVVSTDEASDEESED